MCLTKKLEKTSVIIQPNDSEFEENHFIVQMVGENNLGLKKGDEIVMMSSLCRTITVDEVRYCVFEEENVLAIKRGEND